MERITSCPGCFRTLSESWYKFPSLISGAVSHLSYCVEYTHNPTGGYYMFACLMFIITHTLSLSQVSLSWCVPASVLWLLIQTQCPILSARGSSVCIARYSSTVFEFWYVYTYDYWSSFWVIRHVSVGCACAVRRDPGALIYGTDYTHTQTNQALMQCDINVRNQSAIRSIVNKLNKQDINCYFPVPNYKLFWLF
jgi:hypothetical protein